MCVEQINKKKTQEFPEKLNQLFRQEIETLIGEKVLLFARYLRNEDPSWNPRVERLEKVQ